MAIRVERVRPIVQTYKRAGERAPLNPYSAHSIQSYNTTTTKGVPSALLCLLYGPFPYPCTGTRTARHLTRRLRLFCQLFELPTRRAATHWRATHRTGLYWHFIPPGWHRSQRRPPTAGVPTVDMAKVSPDATPQTTSSSKSGLTKRQRAHKVLREDTADHLDPISRTVFEKGRVASGFADLESVGLIYPEENLNRALRALGYALVIGLVITYASHPQVFTKSAFTSRLGYSNVCIALDTKPAKYISSVLLQFFSYFCLEYSRTDILRSNAIWEHKRAHGLPNIRWRYYLNVGANVVFAMSSVIFTGIVLMFAPHHGTEQDDHGHDKADNSGDLWVHTMTFIQWIWANAFLLLVNHLDAEFQTRTQKIVFWTYIFFCIVSPLEVIVNYAWFDKEGTYLTPWWLNMFLDYGWLLLHGSIVAAGVPMSTALVRNPKEPRIFYLDPEHFAMKQKEVRTTTKATKATKHVDFYTNSSLRSLCFAPRRTYANSSLRPSCFAPRRTKTNSPPPLLARQSSMSFSSPLFCAPSSSPCWSALPSTSAPSLASASPPTRSPRPTRPSRWTRRRACNPVP